MLFALRAYPIPQQGHTSGQAEGESPPIRETEADSGACRFHFSWSRPSIGKLLERLQDIQHRASPWEQLAINRIYSVALELASRTEAAIGHPPIVSSTKR